MADASGLLSRPAEVAGTAARAALALAFYYWITLPLAWEYSYAGFLLAALLGGAMVLAVPRGRRARTLAEALVFLYVLNVRQKTADAPAAWQAATVLVALVAYPALARLAAGLRWRRGLASAVLALAVSAALDPNLLPAWRDFRVRYESPPLVNPVDRIPYFRTIVADLDRDGRSEVVVATEAPWQPDQAQFPVPQRHYLYRVLAHERGGFLLRPPRPEERLVSVVKPDPVLTPPLRPRLRASGPETALSFRLPEDPFASATLLADPGRLPWAFLADTADALAGAPPSPGRGTVAPPWHDAVARVAGPAAAGAAWTAATADVDSDGAVEDLVNLPDGGGLVWSRRAGAPLWWAPDASFRFEDYGSLGGQPPLVLASAKGRWGPDPRRYLAGYGLASAEGLPRLERRWKLFVPGLLFPRLADLDGDGRPELVATAYGRHRLVVLEPHGLPMAALTWVAVLAHLAGLLPGRRGPLRALALAAGLAALILGLGGAAFLPDPARALPGAEPWAWLAGARRAPEAGEMVRGALAAADRVSTYQYQAQVITYVGGARNQLDLAGGVAGARARVQVAFLGAGYGFYQEGSRIYLHDGRRWHRITRPGAAPPPLAASLAALPWPASGYLRLPGEEIVARTRCLVLVTELSPAAVAAAAPAPRAAVDLLRSGRYTLLLWVGKDDGHVRQIQTLAAVPLPDGRTVYQKFLLTFTGFDSPAITVARPPDLPLVDTD